MRLQLFKKIKKIPVIKKRSAIADVQVKYNANIFVLSKNVKNHMGLKDHFFSI